jgi:hypothetical protein
MRHSRAQIRIYDKNNQSADRVIARETRQFADLFFRHYRSYGIWEICGQFLGLLFRGLAGRIAQNPHVPRTAYRLRADTMASRNAV